MVNKENKKGLGNYYSRFHYKFWLICLIVSLGFIQAIPIGFYRFRLVDLILILSSFYFLALLVKGKPDLKVRWLLILYVFVISVRILFEFDPSSGIEGIRALFGMAAAFLAPFIFFVVRESRITRRTAILLIVIACLVSLLSQMGLLIRGEAYASGLVNLGKTLHIETRVSEDLFSLDYQEHTITVWRALAVGITFAVLLCKTKLWIKMLGVIGLILQFAGGGGGRAALLFVFFVPLVLFLFQGSLLGVRRVKKLLWTGIAGLSFAIFYLWAPIGGTGPVKGAYLQTHSERSTEFFKFLTGGKSAAISTQLQDRINVIAEYWDVIISDPSIFFFGKGLAQVGKFERVFQSVMTQSHNMILDIWFLTGIIGLIFFLIFIGYVLLDLIKLLKTTAKVRTVSNIIIAFSFATAVLYMFQWLLFQATISDRSFMIVFFLLAGLLKPTTRWIKELKSLQNEKNHEKLAYRKA